MAFFPQFSQSFAAVLFLGLMILLPSLYCVKRRQDALDASRAALDASRAAEVALPPFEPGEPHGVPVFLPDGTMMFGAKENHMPNQLQNPPV